MHIRIAHSLHIGAREDAAFGDEQALGRHPIQQVQRRLQADFEGACND